MVIDGGLPTHYFADVVGSFSGLIDVIKLGWGTSLVTDDLKYKIDALRGRRSTSTSAARCSRSSSSQNRYDDWRRFCDRFGCRNVEISNGTIDLTNTEKANTSRGRRRLHRLQRGRLQGFGPVGGDAPAAVDRLHQQDLDAGAHMVITEARESGKSGICRPTANCVPA